MSAYPVWDAAVYWPTPQGYAVDRASGRRAFRGPDAEPGTADLSAALAAWGVGNFTSWTQPDGTEVFYQPAAIGQFPAPPPAGPTNTVGIAGIDDAWGELLDSIHRHIPNAAADLAAISVRSPSGG